MEFRTLSDKTAATAHHSPFGVKMSRATSTVVFILLNLVVGICPASFTCDQLPKVDIPSNEILVANSPLQLDFVISSVFECTTVVFTKPARGTTNYNGTAVNVKGSTVIINDYAVGNDKKKLQLKNCNTGERSDWHIWAAQFGNNGGFLCAYICNNTELGDITCMSNNNGASQAELEAVDMARQVSNGNLIHNAWAKCPPGEGCQVFY